MLLIKMKNMVMRIWISLISILSVLSFCYLFKPVIIGDNSFLVIAFIYFFMINLFSFIFNAYKIGVYRTTEILYSEMLSVIISIILIMMIMTLNIKHFPPVDKCFMLFCIESVLSLFWSWLGNRLYYKLNKPHKLLLIHGDNPDELIRKLNKKARGFKIAATIDGNHSFAEIKKECEKYESIMIFTINNDLRNHITNYCFETKKDLFIVPKVAEIIRKSAKTLHLIDTPLYLINNDGLTPDQEFFKRLLDLVIIIPVAVVAAPFMLITALCIKLYDNGPVLYKQNRLTKDGKEFYVYKFRSMIVDAEKNSGARLASENDDRITPVGKIIRKIRFDELPQIINILKGDMSIVGPRPERPEIAKDYAADYNYFNYRLKVKAGLTGYAQIFGKYNTTPVDKLKLDLMYIENYSILLDLQLIIMTIKVIFMPESTEGIEEGQKTAKK